MLIPISIVLNWIFFYQESNYRGTGDRRVLIYMEYKVKFFFIIFRKKSIKTLLFGYKQFNLLIFNESHPNHLKTFYIIFQLSQRCKIYHFIHFLFIKNE